MTFGSDHYVPVLKMKPGEKKALELLSPATRARVTPLLEVVEMDGKKSLSDHITKSFKGLLPGASVFPRCFLDTRELAPAGTAGAVAAFNAAAALPVTFTPVTGISRTADVTAAFAHRQNGIAIRLTRDEFESGRVAAGLAPWMTKWNVTPKDVDLIVDLGAVDDMVADGIAMLADAFLADVPTHALWRTLTVSGCAFPASMGDVGRNSHSFVDRAEWQAWRDGLHARRANLARLPTFSDCAIQHPKGVEGLDFRKIQISAAVRYTLPEQWLLIKGQSTRLVPPGQQFLDLATQLVYGHLRQHFAGADHCAGCRGVQNAADGAPHLGSLGVWRRLGTIHHITRATEELLRLTWP